MNLEAQNYVILEKHNGKHRLLKYLYCEANELHNEHKSPQDKIYMFINRDLNTRKRLEVCRSLL